MKKVLVVVLAVMLLNTVVIASEWWQVNNSTRKCQPVAGNMSPYAIKKVILEHNGAFKFLFKDDNNKLYVFQTELDGDRGFISMADSYAKCNTLVSAMEENGLFK
jgi:uncharacterized protein YxeA